MSNNMPSVSFGLFERDALPERISAKLLSLITEKQLKPGDRLPSERELAAMIHVSRPSLREALRALQLMRVIEIRQGSGTFVSSLHPEMLVEHLDLIFALDDSTFIQLLEARRILEPGIAEIAAKQITADELQKLEQCVMEAKECLNDPEAFLQHDIELHSIITEAAHNPILVRFMVSLNRLGHASRERTTRIPGMPDKVLEDHNIIVNALKQHDPKAAGLAMSRHIEKVQGRLQDQSSKE